MTSTPARPRPEPEHRQCPHQPIRGNTKPARTMPAAAPRAVLQLQSAAGNAAVTGLLAGRSVGVQRLDAGPGGCPPPPVAPPGITAAQDPKFAALKGDIAGKAKTAKAHPPAAAEVKKAQDAAVAPPDDKEAQAKAAQAEKMAGAKPGGFDKAKFIDAVTKAIEAARPKTNEEAKDFASSGKAGEVKSQVAGMVSQGKQDSAKDIAEKTGQAPDPSAAKDKPVAPLPPPEPAPQLAPPAPKKAVPDKAPAEQTELGSTKCELDSKMADADVTEEQLAKSNEPEFTAAVEAKKGAEQHAATAPPAARADEAAALATATGQADAAGKAGVQGMAGARTTATGQAHAAKSGAKAADEKERSRITGEIKKIFDGTKTDVDKILGELDGKVKQKFDAGEQAARAAFEADHKRRMDEYEDRIGFAQWVIDKFRSTQPEVMKIFVDAAATYEKQMKVVISDVADLIGSELDRAKDRIAKGRADVAKFVAEQPKALQGVAKEAAQQIGSQFDGLDSAVDAKQDALVDDLAAQYTEARENVDKRVKELQEENKSWKDKAVDAVGGAIETILKLKDLLLGVLARAAGAVTKIIKDPISFLSNFVNAVKSGVMNFGSNILEHLKKGLQGWLFGALAEAGIEIPDKFDLKGIVKLILSLLGLTWNAIRARIVKVIPEPVMKVIETSVDFVKAILSEGVVGLWKWIAAKLSDLKEMVMGQIRDFVITKVITAGITWLISILNPAAAFIKACKMIYDAVMWFIDNAARLKEFVDSILDSVSSIAGGGVGAVAGYIEQTLAKAVPMVISGLASLLGLGGISDKIKKVLETIQKPVMSVVDKLVAGAVKFGKKLLGKLRRKKKGKESASGAEVKNKVQQELTQGPREFTSAATFEQRLVAVSAKYRSQGLKYLSVRKGGGDIHALSIEAVASPRDPVATMLLKEVGKSAPEILLKLDYKSKKTTMQAIWPPPVGTETHTNIGSGTMKHGRGFHAEEVFAAQLRKPNIWKYPKGSTVEITLRGNRTACPDCAQTLISLVQWARSTEQGRPGVKLQLNVLATSVYSSSPTEEQTKVIPKTRFEDLLAMRRAGIKLGVWDIWCQIAAADPSDPLIKKLGPSIEANAEEAANVREQLAKVEAVFQKEQALVGKKY